MSSRTRFGFIFAFALFSANADAQSLQYKAPSGKEYRADVDLMKLASELAVDAVVPGDRLRAEIIERFSRAADKIPTRVRRKHLVPPV